MPQEVVNKSERNKKDFLEMKYSIHTDFTVIILIKNKLN